MNEEEHRNQFDEATLRFAAHMPLMMHGAGDVPPDRVDPEAAKFVAALACQYISKLVDSALDAQSAACDSSTTQKVPPMPFRHTKRKSSQPDYFDQPLKQPRIRGAPAKPVESSDTLSEDWKGVLGVDFGQDRIRQVYVNGPSFLSTQHFILPVCHDSYAYGRVTEIQAEKRSFLSDLTDPTILNMIREEGVIQHSRAKNDKKKNATEDNDEPSSDEEDEDENEPTWPGLEDLLPYDEE